MNNSEKYQWLILVLLAVIGFFSLVVTGNWPEVLVLMGLAYLSNASYSMVSRSAVRESVLYHAFTTLLSNFVFYMVLQRLVTENMTLVLFIPYTVATVWGSFTGAKTSQKIEERFGITADTSKKQATPESAQAQKILLALLALMAVIVGVYSQNILLTLTIAALAFGDNITFSILRRSRNTSNVTYHIGASLVKSAAWYILFRSLSLKGMSFELFIPYCFGSVLGGISGQTISSWIERKIGATADSHLESTLSWHLFIPWKPVFYLAFLTAPFVIWSDNNSFLLFLAFLSAAQQVSFSLVSRSRQRNNMTYHIIASIFSNGVWFLTFRQLQVEWWTAELFVPYALGGTVGSVMGVGISMIIEKWLGASSDSHIKARLA